MSPTKSLRFLAAAFFISPFISLPCLAAETLREMLAREGIREDLCRHEDLSKEVNGLTEGENPDSRILATHVLLPGASTLDEFFYAFRFDKKSNNWTGARLDWPVRNPDKLVNPAESCQGGTITRIDQMDRYIYLEGHINPSASCTMVVTRDLEFQGTFYGGVVGQFKSGLVIYEHSEVHWAPTHYVELSLYDPIHQTSRKIYPLKPYQSVRTAYIAKVKEVYEACCPKVLLDKTIVMPGGGCSPRFGNHHCDPELFDNYLAGGVLTNDDTDSLVFSTVFSDETKEHPEVVYIFRDISNKEKMQYRGFLLEDLTRRYGKRPLTDFLLPDILSALWEHADDRARYECAGPPHRSGQPGGGARSVQVNRIPLFGG